jgi:propionyl-CoA synthetase
VIPYKGLLDSAIDLAAHKPEKVLLFNRELAPMQTTPERDIDWANFRLSHMMKRVPCEWVESSHPSYILYTSGTTGKPKGAQRDTGGYAVALASSMHKIFGLKPGETMFCTSDIGWVVGHCYIVYGPLIAGNTTIMYEGVPTLPDPAIWWKICAENNVKTMFSSPTAVRVLKKQDPKFMKQHKLPSLKYLFLAGEPLDEPTARWVSDSLGGVSIIDNYWQTESGWPILSTQVGVEDTPRKFGSPSFPVYGFNVKLKHESTGAAVGADEKGVLTIVPPLPPGAMSTVWGDDERFVKTYFSNFSDEQVYSSFDWATRDADGYYFILGRTDDVINVAGHRLGTREIEEAVQQCSLVAECAVVGVSDQLKGQTPIAFVVLKDPKADTKNAENEVIAHVNRAIGAIAKPSAVHFVTLLPKTRSGKLLRRSIQALAEGRDPGDLTTIEDPAALQQIKLALGQK